MSFVKRRVAIRGRHDAHILRHKDEGRDEEETARGRGEYETPCETEEHETQDETGMVMDGWAAASVCVDVAMCFVFVYMFFHIVVSCRC